ncbi:MAG: metallophosphoesterase [Clostridia bacterium]|nr:metallophosphoesterase [Clostridia bacterium]
MKQVKHVSDIYTGENDILYTTENGLHVRDVVVEAGIGGEIYIGHVSDLHYNYCNQQDLDEANPVVLSTLENRKWLANGESVPKARRCMEFLDDVDQIVINGDTLDYLSYGCMELMQKEIWDKYPDVIATLGGHEVVRRMQGVVPDETTRESRLEILEKFWKHDIYYISRVVKDKVLIIGLFNDLACYSAYQEEKLRSDLELAREKGYAVLIFQHEPICTKNPIHKNITVDDIITVGDTSGFPRDFCDGDKLAGSSTSDEQTKAVYSLISGSADVVKAVFAGHYHDDMYLEILGSTPDGREAYIPQYVHTATAYDEGHLMRITVK